MAGLRFALLIGSLLLTWPVRCQEDEEPDQGHEDDPPLTDEEEIISKEKLRALHAKFDKNHDGKVSLAEVLEFASHMSKAIAGRDVEAILEEIDTNKDGKLSLKEHLDDLHRHADKEDEEEMKELELRKAMEAAKFKAADSDHDEVLSPQEVASLFYPETNSAVLRVVVGETMKNKDTDGDGRLSFKEFAEAEEDPEEVNVEGTKPMEEDEKLQLEEEMKDFKKLDKNGDGLLDMDELAIWESGLFHTEAAMIHLLQIADKDGDNQATAEELENAREELASSDAHGQLMEWADSHEL